VVKDLPHILLPKLREIAQMEPSLLRDLAALDSSLDSYEATILELTRNVVKADLQELEGLDREGVLCAMVLEMEFERLLDRYLGVLYANVNAAIAQGGLDIPRAFEQIAKELEVFRTTTEQRLREWQQPSSQQLSLKLSSAFHSHISSKFQSQRSSISHL
jgi:hypothetical protein